MANIRKQPVLRMSDIYAPTLKEDPSDADIESAKLLVRAGMIRKEAAGLYTFLPLGMRVISKIETIVREEMDSHGGQEILMPFVQPARAVASFGPLGRLRPRAFARDRPSRQRVLPWSPRTRKSVTDLVNNELRSYKDLPKSLDPIQGKFRDERRPRFALMRAAASSL